MRTFKQFLIFNEEQAEVHHASVIPLVGISPISHMGHKADLGNTLKKLPGEKHIGVSSKETTFTPTEREDVLKRQWDMPDLNVHHSHSGGDVIANAYNSLPKKGKKVLHILVGHDRQSFAHGLKKSLEDGTVKEMEGKKWDEIHIHHPEDTNRSHGMSGTSMRAAVASGDTHTFDRHIGPMFSKKEKKSIFEKMKGALSSGKLKVKRK